MEVYELCDTDLKELVIGKIVKDAIMKCEDAPSRNSSNLLKGITIGIILD
jgi:hypothetical protein